MDRAVLSYEDGHEYSCDITEKTFGEWVSEEKKASTPFYSLGLVSMWGVRRADPMVDAGHRLTNFKRDGEDFDIRHAPLGAVEQLWQIVTEGHTDKYD